jgi:hypothetical protein
MGDSTNPISLRHIKKPSGLREEGILVDEDTKCPTRRLSTRCLAEAVRFELTDVVKHRRFSRPVHSTALPRFQWYCGAELYVNGSY